MLAEQDANNFHDQFQLLLFDRLILAEIPAYIFIQQYRIIPDIGQLVSDLDYEELFIYVSNIVNRPEENKVVEFNK
jgi:hypothetical protein